MTEIIITNVDGKPLSRRGLDTRRRLLDAAERVFGDLGFHDASVRRVRHAMKEGSSQGKTRLEAELLGFDAYFRFTASHPALYRIIRQAEFVSPEMLHYHYDRLSRGYIEALAEAVDSGEIGQLDPSVTAWALMGMGELIGMRWILWGDGKPLPDHVFDELARIVRCVLEATR